jgi:hypothetical protein
MSTEASIQITSPNKTTEQIIDQSLYLLFIDGEIETSQSDGPVKLEFADGIVTVKIQDDVDNATFSGHPLRKGAIYFLEDEDSISFGESKITLKSSLATNTETPAQEEDLDLFELHATDSPAPEKQESQANDDLILEVDQLIADSDDSSEDSSPVSFDEDNTEPKFDTISINDEDLTHGEFKLDTGEATKTSIAVHELLQTHNKKNDNIPPEALKAQREELKKVRAKKKVRKKKKSRADQDLDLDGASRFNITEKSQGKKTKAKVKIIIPTENTVGPIVRILGVFSTLAISIFANRYVDLKPIQPIADKLEEIVNQQLVNKGLSEIPMGVFEVLTVFLLIEIVSRILFSVSLPHFVAGVTNYGSFLTKRLKALLKLPLDWVSMVCPLGEIPVVIGKRSVKEMVTLSQTRYRSGAFKLVAPLIIVIGTVFFCYESIFTTQTLKPDEFSTAAVITNYKKKKATSLSSLSMAKGVANNYYIDGTMEGRPYYLFVHKENKTLLEYRNLAKYDFKKVFSKIAEKAPFFEYTHPFLYQYLQDGKSNKKVREDVLRFIRSGELTNYKIPQLIPAFDPIMANEAHQLFKRFGIRVDSVMSDNKFYRIYRHESDYYALYISEHTLYTFSITASDETTKKAITQIHFQPAVEGGLRTDLESGNSNYEEKVKPLLQPEPNDLERAAVIRYIEITQKKVPADF